MNGDLAQMTMESLALMKNATTTGLLVSTGFQFYDLEAKAKRLYPVLTPLRNQIARVTKPGYGVQPHWKVLADINASAFGISSGSIFIGVSEGNRNAQMATKEVDYTASYKGIGLENSVTFEAEYAGQGFDDLRSLAQTTLLEATMIGEENMILTGNTSLQLGTTPTPTGVASGSDGGFATATAFFFCVALTPLGLGLAGGLFTPATGAGVALTQAIISSFTRTNADASTDTINGGSAQISAQGSVATTSTNHVVLTVAGVKGAAAYAWFVGVTTGAANCKLAAITSIPTVTVYNAGNAGNQAANYTGSGTDNSTNALSFDGLVTMGLTGLGGTAGYYVSLQGAALTSDGHGGVNEIDAMLKFDWDNFRLQKDDIWVGSNAAKSISNIVLAGTSNPVYNLIMQNGNQQGEITAGSLVTRYLNKYAMEGAKPVNIRLHPNMPAGWIFGNITHVPYPNANVPGVARMVTRQEYYAREWPVVTRKYQYGVYADEVLQHYVPFGMGLIADAA
jgi:hypothetical protein